MLPPFEIHREQFIISTDPSRLVVDAIAGLLSRSYWAKDRTREHIERALAHSLVFGLYNGSRQIGLARVISDYTTFAYLCDVLIHEDCRGRGPGKWLLWAVHNHPGLLTVHRWILVTNDAHSLYSQFGYTLLEQPERWMVRFHD